MSSIFYEKRFDTGTQTDVSEDFTLPDYHPEIRRIVGVRAAALIDGKYLSGDDLEADGSVVYTVSYSDADGRLNEVTETSSFTGRIPTNAQDAKDDRYSASDLVLGASAEGIICRVSGPRRFTLSSRVRLTLLSQKPVDLALDPGKLPSVRQKTERTNTACLAETRTSAEVSGEIRERDDMEIAGGSGQICLTDARAADGALSLKGDAMVTVLLRSPENGYAVTKGRAPVELTVPLPEVPRGVVCRAAAFPSVALTELEISQDGTISWRMEYDVDADVLKCTEAEYASDAYSPAAETDVRVRETDVTAPAAALNGRLTVSSRYRAREGAEFITAWGTAAVEKITASGGRARMAGTVKATVVSRADGEFISEDVVIPFRYEWEALEGGAGPEECPLSCKCAVTAADITVRTAPSDAGGEAEGPEWTLTCELGLSAVCVSTAETRAVVGLEPKGDGEPPKKNLIRVYVPENGENAWSVEKKFRLGKDAALTEGVYVMD